MQRKCAHLRFSHLAPVQGRAARFRSAEAEATFQHHEGPDLSEETSVTKFGLTDQQQSRENAQGD